MTLFYYDHLPASALRVGLIQALAVMEPLLAEAYEAILHMERLTGASLLNRQSLRQDAKAGNSDLQQELAEFNRLVAALHSRLSTIDLADLKEQLIHIRIHAMNVDNEFSRLADSIQQAFVAAATRRDG